MLVTEASLRTLLVLVLAGCGANVVFQGEDGEGGGGGSTGAACSTISFDFDAPASECTTGTTCDIVGFLPDGRQVRETCISGKTATCTLSIDDVAACACPADRIDYASTCSNGVPTCLDWKVDWSDIAQCNVP